MTRIVRAYHVLSDEGVPIAVIYPIDGVFPFPSKKTPDKVTQTLQTLQRIEQVRHPPTQEQVKRAYGHTFF